jgi:hypothetical protein
MDDPYWGIAIGSAAAKAPKNARFGCFIGIGHCLLVVFGVGTCDAAMFLG